MTAGFARADTDELTSAEIGALWRKTTAWIVGAFLLRSLISFFVPLLPDETYYWDWSRQLAAGYFDHPPGIAYLIAAGTALFGNTTLGVRFGPGVAALIAHIAIVHLSFRLGGVRAALRAACLVTLVPLATLGLVLATPDAPLLACAAVALLSLERALCAPVRSERSLKWWTLTGVALGFAFLSKYTAVLLPASLVAACVVYAPLRKRLFEPGPYVASVIALLMFAPVVMWNAAHKWVSFRFQVNHGFGHVVRGTPVGREFELIGGQLALATPIFGVLMFATVVALLRHAWARRTTTAATDGDAVRFALGATAITPLIFFAISAWQRPVEANWPALFYPAGITLLASNTMTWATQRWWKYGVSFAVVLLALLVAQTWRPLAPIAPAKDPIARAYGWSDLGVVVGNAVHSEFLRDTKTKWIAGDRYQDASEMAFHVQGQPQVFTITNGGRSSQYELWPGVAERIQANDGLVAAFDANDAGDELAAKVAEWFAESRRGNTVQLRRNDGMVTERRIWLFRNARAIPPDSSQLRPADAHR